MHAGRRCICIRSLVFNEVERDRWVARQAAALAPGSRVLDVGAGPCRYRKLFRHCDYRAHDFAQLPPQQVRGGCYGKLDYVSDILSLPVADASFDCVLCTEVLEHVPEPIRAIREMARVLRPGGRLTLTAPLRSGIHQEPYHFYGGFSPSWYERFLPEAAFTDLGITPNGGFFLCYGEASQRFVNLLFPPRGPRRRWRLFCLPVWLILKLCMGVLVPLVCRHLDSLDTERRFTAGYFVTARRGRDSETPTGKRATKGGGLR